MSVMEEWGMECPKCKENGSLSVEVKVMARLTSYGTETQGDEEWDHDSLCICDTCGRHGKVSDFKALT